jgi:hypothetical protein
MKSRVGFRLGGRSQTNYVRDSHDIRDRVPYFVSWPTILLMKWRRYWPQSLFAILVVSIQGSRWIYDTKASPLNNHGWSNERKLAVRLVQRSIGRSEILRKLSREKVRDLWYHGFNNYMTFGSWPCLLF